MESVQSAFGQASNADLRSIDDKIYTLDDVKNDVRESGIEINWESLSEENAEEPQSSEKIEPNKQKWKIVEGINAIALYQILFKCQILQIHPNLMAFH